MSPLRAGRTELRSRLSMDPAAMPAMAFLCLLLVAGTLLSDVFLSVRNIGNVLTNVTPLLLIAVGQTFVIGSRGLDLSVGVVATLAATIVATLGPQLGLLGVVVALGAGALVGLVNGLGVRWGLEPFLMTLASLSVVQGIVFIYQPSPGGTVPAELTGVAGTLGPIPVALPIVVLATLAAAVVLRRTRLGAHLLASGGDSAVARLAGVRVERSLMAAYVICSTLAAVAGVYLAARTRTGDPLIGQGFTLDSVAAVVLGGSLLAGGRVTILGTLVGTVCLGLLPNVLNLTGVSYVYQQPIKGLLLIAAVLLPAAVARIGAARRRQHAASQLEMRAASLP
ncbi:MAG: ABC transporter permease [Chloroflexota bacterium]